MSELVQEKPTVSALIITYNRRGHIGRAIDSILAQSLPVYEIVIVDDGSTDGTAEMIESQYGPLVKIVRQENRGVSYARQRAIHEARGTWVAFLDSDDAWVPNRNQVFMEMVAKVPQDVGWIFGDLQIVTDDTDRSTIFQEHGLKVDELPHVFDDALRIHHPFQFCMLQSSLIQRQALTELNCFSEGLRHSEDVLAGYQVAARYRFSAIPSVVTRLYRTSDLQSSSTGSDERLRPDYFKARMLAFALVIQSGKKHPWSELYADAVRGLCKFRAQDGLPIRGLALEQFRFSRSFASVAFFCIAMCGGGLLRVLRTVNAKLKPEPEGIAPPAAVLRRADRS